MKLRRDEVLKVPRLQVMLFLARSAKRGSKAIKVDSGVYHHLRHFLAGLQSNSGSLIDDVSLSVVHIWFTSVLKF